MITALEAAKFIANAIYHVDEGDMPSGTVVTVTTMEDAAEVTFDAYRGVECTDVVDTARLFQRLAIPAMTTDAAEHLARLQKASKRMAYLLVRFVTFPARDVIIDQLETGVDDYASMLLAACQAVQDFGYSERDYGLLAQDPDPGVLPRPAAAEFLRAVQRCPKCPSCAQAAASMLEVVAGERAP